MEFGSGGGGGGSGGGDHDSSDAHRRKKRYHRHTANQIQRLEGYIIFYLLTPFIHVLKSSSFKYGNRVVSVV